MPRRRMRGGEDFGMGDMVQDAALIGTGAYLAGPAERCATALV